MELSARQFKAGDEREIIELLEMCFKGWPERDLNCSKEEFWRWKYCDNPLRPGLVILGIHDDKIIGCNHGNFLNIKMGDKTVFCSQGSDLCVHPDYRRMGVSNIMRETRDQMFEKLNVVMSYATAENPIVQENRKKRGWPIFPQPIVELVKIADISLHLEMTHSSGSWFKLPVFQIVKLVEGAKMMYRRPAQKNTDFTIRRVIGFDERIDIFYNEVKEFFNFLLEKKKEYLNWRYSDPRGGVFTIMQAESNNAVCGYIVLRINRHFKDYPVGWIVDLLVMPDRLDVAEALVEKAIEFFDSYNVNVVRYWVVKGSSYVDVLNNCGFMDIRKNAPQVSANPRNIEEEYNVFMNSDPFKLHIQIGDTEYI